ncbi:MAG: hypothetical protein IJQ08_05150 [Synergistaceae bacterium]|nr:hypothetical protein [Synergistaceae bacterium]
MFLSQRNEDPARYDLIPKMIWIAVMNASQKWTMPISNWSKALHHFYVKFADRFPKVA